MDKRVSLICLLSLAFVLLSASYKVGQSEDDYLNGTVRSVSISDIYLVNEQMERIEGRLHLSGGYLGISKVYYHRNGQIAHELDYIKDGKFTKKMSYTYNKEGYLIEVVEKRSKRSKNFTSKLFYDSLGRRTQSLVYDYLDSLDYKTDYHYKDDFKTSLSYYGDGRKAIKNHQVVSEFDSLGNLICKQHFSGNGELEGNEEYDDSGNLVFEQRYDTDGEITSTSEYAYNALGQKIKSIMKLKYTTFEWYSEYNEKGQCISEYDKRNKEVGPNISFQYELDSLDNWIKKTVFKEEAPYGIIERVIEYY